MNNICVTAANAVQMRCKGKDNKDDKDSKEGGLDFQDSRLLDSTEYPTKKRKNAHTLAYIKKK